MYFILALVRRLVYRMGYRPKYLTVLYSPSLDLLYGVKDADIYKTQRNRGDHK